MEFNIPEEHPFSVILPLVEEGKIDPWSIDIASLANLYIEQIKTMEFLDMRIPANALSAATFLFKKKMEILFPKPKIQRQRVTLKELVDMFDQTQNQEPAQEPSQEEPKKIERAKSHSKVIRKPLNKKRKIPLHRSILKDIISDVKNILEDNKKIYFSHILQKDKSHIQFTALMFLQYDKYADIHQEKPFGDILIKKI